MFCVFSGLISYFCLVVPDSNRRSTAAWGAGEASDEAWVLELALV
jgi:hypothetical protein